MTLTVTECIATDTIQCDGYELLKIYFEKNIVNNKAMLCFIQCRLWNFHTIKKGDTYYRYENETQYFNCSKFVHGFVKRFGIFEKDFLVV